MESKCLFAYRKFGGPPRVLVIRAAYFGYEEYIETMRDLKWEVAEVYLKELKKGSDEFLKRLLYTIAVFKPDFVFTVNHFGFDEEGKLREIFETYNIIFFSWFLENPFFILEDVSKQLFSTLLIFCWDSYYIPKLKEKGFSNSFFLPHGLNPKIFYCSGHRPYLYGISFVGNSMEQGLKKTLKKLGLKDIPPDIVKNAALFAAKKENGSIHLENTFEEYLTTDNSPMLSKKGLILKALTVWKGNQIYRSSMLSAIKGHELTVFGDNGWKRLLNGGCRLEREVSYYSGLKEVYASSRVNLNLTSIQMPYGLNQRVFDVPAAGGFLLTDYQEDLQRLFDIKREVAFFTSKEEMLDKLDFYLRNESSRQEIVKNAQVRIMQDHTLKKRLIYLYKTVKKVMS